jgi:ligand-binding sensor domain-containing protein
MKYRSIYFLCCFLLLKLQGGLAQTYPFINYTIENGLPQSTVYHAFQDQKGYLWAGTQGGVCRFDGREFKVWDSQSGLPDNHVTSIHESPDGTLWFGHRSGALSFLKNNKIQLLSMPVSEYGFYSGSFMGAEQPVGGHGRKRSLLPQF